MEKCKNWEKKRKIVPYVNPVHGLDFSGVVLDLI